VFLVCFFSAAPCSPALAPVGLIARFLKAIGKEYLPVDPADFPHKSIQVANPMEWCVLN
jgi:hypothetical protein